MEEITYWNDPLGVKDPFILYLLLYAIVFIDLVFKVNLKY